MRGKWIDSVDLPSDFEIGSTLITFPTGKENNHLVPVIYPSETLNAVKFLADTFEKALVFCQQIIIYFPAHNTVRAMLMVGIPLMIF